MISIVELEGHIANANILSIIVGKLYHRKKLCLIILLKVDKNLEIGFHCAILPFDLTVRLWMESGGEFPLDAKEIA